MISSTYCRDHSFQCIIQQLLDSVFVIVRIIKVDEGRGCQLKPLALPHLNYFGYHKNLINNCLKGDFGKQCIMEIVKSR